MTLFNKIKWVLGILMVFVLIITTNLLDKNSFNKVKNSVETIYEDRLVAKNIIFDLSNAIHQKELAIATYDSIFFINKNIKLNSEIEASIAQFESTKLTLKEKNVFGDLKENLESLESLETDFVTSKFENKQRLANQILVVKENLYDLNEIQLKEGERQISISKRAIDTVELFTQIEIYLLIFLAIVIQIIIIYNPKKED